MRNQKAFTLVELLLAIAIMGILASIVIVAINPGKQMGDARNTQRKFDVNTLLNAFGQYSIDANGYFQPRDLDGTPLSSSCAVGPTAMKLCKATITHSECISAGCAWSRHLSGAYISNIPEDPDDTESGVNEDLMVDYLVRSIAPGRFEVVAPNAENGIVIGSMR